MSDRLTVEKPTEQSSISVHNELEIQKWMTRFLCSRDDLLYAVNKIGTSAFKVEAYLKRRQR
jgi:thiamine monophosphate kinase